MKKIGVIGGMGPEATISFYQEIINIFQKKYKASYDADYPEIYLINLPIPDIVENVSNLKLVEGMMKASCMKLKNLGAEIIAVPCNTINIIYDKYGTQNSIPVLNLVRVVGEKVQSAGLKKMGLLATKTTYNYKLYEKEFSKLGLEINVPEEKEREEINKIIMRILNGKRLLRDKETLLNISNKLTKQGCQGIILGCTELPLLMKQSDFSTGVFDTIKILADFTVDFCMRDKK